MNSYALSKKATGYLQVPISTSRKMLGWCIQLGHSFFRINASSLFNNHPVFNST